MKRSNYSVLLVEDNSRKRSFSNLVLEKKKKKRNEKKERVEWKR